MNDSPLINTINLDKVDCINKDARFSEFIEKTKNWNLYNLKGCLPDDITDNINVLYPHK